MHRRVGMTHILRRLEDAESQRGKEVARCQQPGGWSKRETGIFAQKVIHFLQLWDAIFDKDFLLFESGEDAIVLAAGVLWHEILDDLEHGAPGLMFDFAVVDVGNGIAAVDGNISVIFC